MTIQIIDQPDEGLINFLHQKIVEFNAEHWEPAHRQPLAVQVTDDEGRVIAGCGGETFGHWLLIKTLWVSAECRGQRLGGRVLDAMEGAAVTRGCKRSLLDTLDFQAMPFYKKRGYDVVWVQEDYPKTGRKYFMVKQLG